MAPPMFLCIPTCKEAFYGMCMSFLLLPSAKLGRVGACMLGIALSSWRFLIRRVNVLYLALWRGFVSAEIKSLHNHSFRAASRQALQGSRDNTMYQRSTMMPFGR